MKKSRFFSLPIMLLALGLIFAGCDSNSSGSESESWSKITNLSEADGTWTGSYSQSMTMRQWNATGGALWTSSEENFFGDTRMQLTIETTMIINSRTRLMTGVNIITQVYYDGKINNANVWQQIKNNRGQGWTFDDSARSATLVEGINETISDSDMVGYGYEINRKGDKARAPASEFGFFTDDYIIFTKQ